MSRTTRTIRTSITGRPLGAVVTRIDGRRTMITPDAAGQFGPDHRDVYAASLSAERQLLADPLNYPTPVSDGLAWLRMVGRAGVTGEAARIASVLAMISATDSISLADIGRPVGISKRNTWRAIERLVGAGLLLRRREAGLCQYVRVAP